MTLRQSAKSTRDWQQRTRERAREREREGKKTGQLSFRPRKVSQRERRAQQLFFAGLGTSCENCGYTPEPRRRERELERHHTIRQQVLRHIASTAGLDEVELVWDPDWGMTLCTDPAPERCHERHTSRFARVEGSKVPAAAWVRAEELDDQLEAAGVPRTAILELRREHP
jgi:hypothetical protein